MDPSLVRFRAVVEGALTALEARRQEINDLNVFPVAVTQVTVPNDVIPSRLNAYHVF